MSVYKLRTKEEWINILDDLRKESGMVVGLANADGDILHISGDRPPVCFHVREDEDALKYICSRSHNVIAEEAKAAKKAVVDFCEGGMIKAVVPIYHEEKWVGNFSFCGCLDVDEEVDTLTVEKNLDVDEATAMSWYHKMPKTTNEKVEALVDKISKMFS